MTRLAKLTGQRVTNVRPMTREEKEREGWKGRYGSPLVIEMEDGTIVYASQDEEGNGPGRLFRTSEEHHYHVSAEQ